MGYVNKVILLGNLGKDPEIRQLPSGQNVASFSLATTENYTSKTGERVKQTEWHRITAFGRLADLAGKYLHKGKQVYIEGKLRTRQWEDNNHQKHSTTEIVVLTIQLLGQANSGGSSQDDFTEPVPDPAANSEPSGAPDDDVPF
jgi:single-strand DNA-binding protein